MITLLSLYPGPCSFRQEQLRRERPFLRELGVEVVLADDYITPLDRELFDSVIELPPPEFTLEAWRVLERELGARRIDALLAQSESGLLLGSLCSKHLGLRGITPNAAHLCVNKVQARRALAAAGIGQPRFALASNVEDVRRFADGASGGHPLMLKPAASALGRLVTLVRTPDEVEDAVRRVRAGLERSSDVRRLCEFAEITAVDLGCDPRTQFLVESFASGDAVETDGLVVGTTPHSFGVTGQVLSRPPLFFLEAYLSPADRPPHELELIERTSAAALRALGVQDSGYSIELRIDAGRIELIEVNGRLGWDEGFGDMFEAVLGQSPMRLALELALGREPRFERRSDVHAALAYRSCYENRLVRRVPSELELAVCAQSVEQAGLAVYAGQRMFAPPSPDATVHLAWALATDARSSSTAHERARAAVDSLRFELELANDD